MKINKAKFLEHILLWVVTFIVITGLTNTTRTLAAKNNDSITFEFADGTKVSWSSGKKKIDISNKKISYVYFGSYPQKEVKGKALTSEIKQAKYDKSGIATVNGEKYKRISYEDINYNTDYRDEEDYSYRWDGRKYLYFKFETIKWRVMSNDNGELLLLSELGLDDQRFYNYKIDESSLEKNIWDISTIRKWLNDTFYNNAFNNTEGKFINKYLVDACENPEYENKFGNGEDTIDKVFLLCYEDIYNHDYGFVNDYTRRCSATEYAKAIGAYSENEEKTFEGEYTSDWWLRIPGMYDNEVAYVGESGSCDLSGSKVQYDYVIRPAISLNIKKMTKGVVDNSIARAMDQEDTIIVEFSDGSQKIWSGDKIDINGKKVKNIYFGMYPQTKLVGNQITDKIINADYSAEHTAVVDGKKIYRYEYASSNRYEYFKVEKIKWRVLTTSNGKALLLSEFALDSQPYDNVDNGKKDTWQTSSLRKWLKNEFFNKAFSTSERKLIVETKLKNNDNTFEYYTVDGGANTKDKVFLLELNDLVNKKYGFTGEIKDNDDSRMCAATEYAVKMGADNLSNYTSTGYCSTSWWIRTPGTYGGTNVSANYVVTNGSTSRYIKAVRPALYLNINKIVK